MFENFLAEISSKNKDFRHVCLRYFNAAGADYENNLGPRHKKMTHLIPLLISFEIGLRKEFIIFGNDYNTKDGTCVRDYVHVLDICDAHLKALKYLTKFNEEHYFNLGSAVGFSVLDVVLDYW
jgi:UDP-glucose 4-epimerase